MSGERWLVKRNGGLFASDAESAETIDALEDGECTPWEPIGIRDGVSFRKYWVMCTVIAKNVRQIEIDRINRQPVWKRIFSKEDVSDAIKLGTGQYTDHPVASTEYAIREPRSIGYKRMNPAQWGEYVKRVAPFVQKKILPDVHDPVAQDDLLRMLNKWLREVEREGAQEQAA